MTHMFRHWVHLAAADVMQEAHKTTGGFSGMLFAVHGLEC